MTRTSRYVGLISFLALFVACGPDSRPGGGSASLGDSGSTITLLTPGDDYLLSPLGFLPEMHFVSDPLHLITDEPTRQGDSRTWLYRIRPGIRWHDGAPFTTRDIEFSSAFYRHPDVAMEDPESQALTVLDDSTFTLTYHQGYPVPITYGVYLPEHILGGRDPADRHDWDYWRRPIGYGPFRYVRTTPGEFMELEANPDWHLGQPRIDRVILKLGGNPLAELLAENVDMASVSTQDARALEHDPRFKVHWDPARKLTHLYWNHRRPALGDVRVRKALTLAIDRHELARSLDFGEEYFEMRPRDVYVSDGQIERGDYPDPIPLDTDSAAALLEEAGWMDRDGDGLRERNGTPLRFHLLTNGGRSPVAVVLQSQWRRVGAEAVIDVMDQGGALARVREGDFDAFISSGNWGNAQDALTNTASRRSQTGYENPEFDRLMEAVELASSSDEEEEALRAIWPILHEEVPVTLLLPQSMWALTVHRRIRDASYLSDLPWMWIDEKWEEKGATEEGGGT